MSKGGGAGKVYFVLYLAVVLELLIIIVERDEAEQGLIKKQRETMKIVESILSQLQSGAGTEGINTRPQDEITIPPSGVNIKEIFGIDIKSSRKYIVEVGVTDVTAELKRREGESEKEYAERLIKSIQLGNVEELEYQIFFNNSPDPNNAAPFPTDEMLKEKNIDFLKMQPGQTVEGPDGSVWTLKAVRKLVLDKEQTFNRIDLKNVTSESLEPIYPLEKQILIGPSFKPNDKPEDSVFFYSRTASNDLVSGNLKKRSFIVNFMPPNEAGWFKLRFASRTNKILGVRKEQSPTNIPEDTKVNIGTVTLTVKDLIKVKKELQARLEKWNPPDADQLAVNQDFYSFKSQLEKAKERALSGDNPNEDRSKLDLYGYIATLLAPGMSTYFDQNKGSIEFNVHVVLPKVVPSKPEVFPPEQSIACFDKVPGVFEFDIAPYQGTQNIVEARVLNQDGSPVAKVNLRPADELNASLGAPPAGGKRKYRGVVDNALSPGKYVIEMTHRIGSQPPAVAKTDFDVFKTSLTKDNEDLLNSRLEYISYGDQFLIMNATPTSGGKIRPEQFRIYLSTDIETQTPAINGLSITRENAIFLSCKAKTATMRIAWVQPFTGTEVDIFPAKTVEIQQKRPRINPAENIPTVTAIAANKLRVTIRNLKVVKALDGAASGSEADLKVTVSDKVQFGSTLQGIVDLSNEPTIELEGESYTVNFDVTLNLPRGVDNINGIATVTVRAEALNKCNGKRSSIEDKAINVTIRHEVQRGGQQRPTAPGGTGGQQPRRR